MSLTTETPIPLPTLHVESWADPVVDELGVDPRGSYTERFWLPVLGPSTIWFLRRVADRLDDEPEGFDLDLADVARCLGVGMRGGRNAPILKTVERCCRFGAARMYGHTNIEVRRRLAPLNRAQTERLPESLQSEHDAWLARPQARTTAAQLQERARRLALSLLELGEVPEACERQLHRWRFHPAIAFEAVRWASAAHQAMAAAAPAPVAALTTRTPTTRLAAADSGSSLPRPVPTVDPAPGSRSLRPPRPAIGASRPSAAGGPSVSPGPAPGEAG